MNTTPADLNKTAEQLADLDPADIILNGGRTIVVRKGSKVATVKADGSKLYVAQKMDYGDGCTSFCEGRRYKSPAAAARFVRSFIA